MTRFNRAGAVFAGFALVLCAWVVGAQPLPVAKPEQVGMSAQRLAKIGKRHAKTEFRVTPALGEAPEIVAAIMEWAQRAAR